MQVDNSFYRMIQKMRLEYKLKHGIKIKSDKQITGYLALKPKMFSNKSLIKQIRKMGL